MESTTEPELTEANPDPGGVRVKVEFDESDEKRRGEVGEQGEPQGERVGLGLGGLSYGVRGLDL